MIGCEADWIVRVLRDELPQRPVVEGAFYGRKHSSEFFVGDSVRRQIGVEGSLDGLDEAFKEPSAMAGLRGIKRPVDLGMLGLDGIEVELGQSFTNEKVAADEIGSVI